MSRLELFNFFFVYTFHLTDFLLKLNELFVNFLKREFGLVTNIHGLRDIALVFVRVCVILGLLIGLLRN